MHRSRKSKLKNVPEKILATIEINNWTTLRLLFDELGQSDVQEIGCHFEGISEGRFTTKIPEFLVLNFKDALFVLHLPKLAEEGDKLWEDLGKHIFSNSKITKVFFDCSTACDYLHHLHSISIVNVFDLKVADDYLLETGGFVPFSNESEHKKTTKSKRTMTEFWSAYLPQIQPHEELLLKVTEASNDEEFQVKDVEEYKYKYIALRVKYLLTLKAQMEKAMMSPLQKLLDQTSSEGLDD